MLSCKDATNLMSKQLDEPLTFWERFGLKMHLAICYLCRRANKQISFINLASHQHDENACMPDEKLSDEARKKILDACQLESTED